MISKVGPGYIYTTPQKEEITKYIKFYIDSDGNVFKYETNHDLVDQDSVVVGLFLGVTALTVLLLTSFF